MIFNPSPQRQAREARRAFEAVLDRPYTRSGSLWLDVLTVLAERGQ